jgi:DNA-binding MarR family transcriptional regulator
MTSATKRRAPRARKTAGEAGPRLDEQLCFPLYAASRLVVQAYARPLERLGLTYPQYLVLMVLWEEDGLSVNQIGARLFLDSGTLTPILRRLDEAGFVRRETNAADNRAVENWLTRRGRTLERRAAKVPVELFCQLGMPFGEFKELRGSVRGLLARVAQLVERLQTQDG